MAEARDEKRVLVLQGGGALGAYQAGAYEVLLEQGLEPEWIAGISIGAVNGAIMAGNPPERRIESLRAFWEKVSSGLQGWSLIPGNEGRTLFNDASAWFAILYGIPGFFSPRFPPPTMSVPGTAGALSFYEAEPLRGTLEEFVDFDYLNEKGPRLSVGAVGVESGNFAYFDSTRIRIGPEHIMASGALPPGLPPVVIDGEAFWDGGIVSNTPLQYVMDYERPREDLCIFQLDLFSSKGLMPKTIFDVAEREKEIRYSSRTRQNTNMQKELRALRKAAREVLEKLPPKLAGSIEAKRLERLAGEHCHSAVTVVHLIYRTNAFATHAKDYEFSRLSIEEHWQAGGRDVSKTLENPAWLHRKRPAEGILTLDLA
jgi:NTE family protein